MYTHVLHIYRYILGTYTVKHLLYFESGFIGLASAQPYVTGRGESIYQSQQHPRTELGRIMMSNLKHVPDIRVFIPGTSVAMTRISTEYLSYTDIWRSWTIIYSDIPIPRYTRYMTSYTFRKSTSIYRYILSTEIREKYMTTYTRYMTPYDRAWDMAVYTEYMWSYDGIRQVVRIPDGDYW